MHIYSHLNNYQIVKKLLIYNVGSKYNLSVLKLVKKIAFLMNVKGDYLKVANTSQKEIKNQRLNYSKIQRELKWKPEINLDKGLKITINWYKKIFLSFKIEFNNQFILKINLF